MLLKTITLHATHQILIIVGKISLFMGIDSIPLYTLTSTAHQTQGIPCEFNLLFSRKSLTLRCSLIVLRNTGSVLILQTRLYLDLAFPFFEISNHDHLINYDKDDESQTECCGQASYEINVADPRLPVKTVALIGVMIFHSLNLR